MMQIPSAFAIIKAVLVSHLLCCQDACRSTKTCFGPSLLRWYLLRSPDEVNVLPEDFERSASAPLVAPVGSEFSFLNTSDAPFATQAEGCAFVSFDPRFDELLGANPETRVLGGVRKTTPYAHEAAVYLSGMCSVSCP